MKIGIIGMGNMGSAIISGGIEKNYLNANDIYAYDHHIDKLEKIQGIHIVSSEEELVKSADLLIIAIKPYHIEGFVERNYDLFANKAIVSIALGYTFDKYNKILPASTRHLYIMPNTPCLVGEGMAILEENHSLTDEEFNFAKGLFDALGTTMILNEHQMAIGGTISGCGPAFMFMILEAIGDAGVKYGLPRNKAYELAGKTMQGSAKLMCETGLHPGVLKDQVCSPSGSTIRGVSSLEEDGMRIAMIHAIEKAYKMED